jgi:hypothetical protein
LPRAAAQHLGLGRERRDPRAHVAQLLLARERAHARLLAARIPHLNTRETRDEVRGDFLDALFGHEDASHRGALLARLWTMSVSMFERNWS